MNRNHQRKSNSSQRTRFDGSLRRNSMNINRSIAIPLWGWIALSFLLLLLQSAARAECNGQWDLSGPWNINQGGESVIFNLQQTGNTISGTGSYECTHGSSKFPFPSG